MHTGFVIARYNVLCVFWTLDLFYNMVFSALFIQRVLYTVHCVNIMHFRKPSFFITPADFSSHCKSLFLNLRSNNIRLLRFRSYLVLFSQSFYIPWYKRDSECLPDYCGDQTHLGLYRGFVPARAWAYVSCSVSDQGTTLRASDLHNAQATILNPFHNGTTWSREATGTDLISKYKQRHVGTICALLGKVIF